MLTFGHEFNPIGLYKCENLYARERDKHDHIITRTNMNKKEDKTKCIP